MVAAVVGPSTVKPAPLAAAALAAPLATVMFRSSTSSVVELIVVVVPSICKSPLITTLPVPFGASVILPLLTDTIELPLTSKLPPS